MDIAEILVTAGGVALAAFILWFFLGPGRNPKPKRADSELERVLR